MRPCEPGVRPNEIEPAVAELFMAVISELFDQPILAGHHFSKIKHGFTRLNAPMPRIPHQVPDLSGIQQDLGRHTPSQDSKPAYFFSPLHHHRLQPRARRYTRHRVASAAAHHICEFIIKRTLLTSY